MAKEIDTPEWLLEYIESDLHDRLCAEAYEYGAKKFGFVEEYEKGGKTYCVDFTADCEMHRTIYGDTPDEYDADIYNVYINVDVYDDNDNEIGYCLPDTSRFEGNFDC